MQRLVLALALSVCSLSSLCAQKEYGFDNRKSSGQPYLSPEETVKRMKVPAGFGVKLYASEPLMTNPIAMTVDEKGRVWIIESFEYPKRTAPGKAPRDRIVILEDTDGDGVADKRTVFAEGKDFPVSEERKAKGLGAFDMASGIEVGHGGCFVGAPPYLYHIKDTNGDNKADSFEIVARGFGSQDTHETLNTFTWGPDGWLYGLHGVFTISKVKQGEPGKNDGDPGVDMDAGVWRYHPKLKKFEMFAEGTSNPWGMDFTSDGECIICCCVIPHLFHIVPGGIYIKQGGKPSYNQYAYGAIKEICNHTFHKESGWAHAGLLSLDYPHMPAEYRNSVIFGSIHGCSLKRNTLKPNGSTYVASRADDFLVSGDKNFRPIQMRWMPDGSILVSDWHDQNPCHQTKADEWDYDKGRIYRIVPPKSELKDETNPFMQKTKLRLAMEKVEPVAGAKIQINAGSLNQPPPLRETLVTMQTALVNNSPVNVLLGFVFTYETQRALSLRTLGDFGSLSEVNQKSLAELLKEEKSIRVLREAASVCVKLSKHCNIQQILTALYAHHHLANDPVIPHLLWLATEQQISRDPFNQLGRLAELSQRNPLLTNHIVGRAFRRYAAFGRADDLKACLVFIEDMADTAVIKAALEGMAEAVKGRRFEDIKQWKPLAKQLKGLNQPEITKLVMQLSASFYDAEAMAEALSTLKDAKADREARRNAIQQLALVQEAKALPVLVEVLRSDADVSLRQEAARGLANFNDSNLAKELLADWSKHHPVVRAELVNTLRSRKPWAYALLTALGNKQIPRADVNDNVAMAIRQFRDNELNALLDKHYGAFRDSPAEIDALINKLRVELPKGTGDAKLGKAVFAKHCQQCHKFEGEGHDVGPVLDGAERTKEYLLANIIDPNRVVGTPYFSRTVVMKNGKLITGILVEEDATTLRLKRENAVIEVIVKADIEEQSTSTKSLMPEGMSNNMTVQDLRDLIRYLEAVPKATNK